MNKTKALSIINSGIPHSGGGTATEGALRHAVELLKK